MKKILLLSVFCWLTNSAFSISLSKDTLFTSVTVKPTVAYINYHGEVRRMARLIFNDGKCYTGGRLVVDFNETKEVYEIPVAATGVQNYEIALPGKTIKTPQQLTVVFNNQGQSYTSRAVVTPCKSNWTVYVLPHSHVDIGYTNVQSKVLKLHMDNIDAAIELAKKTQNYPEEARYKWTTEAIWVVDNYLKMSSPEKQQRFWDAVKKGWISLDGAYGNINTSLTDSRQLMEMFAASQRLARAHGIDIHTMFQGDVPGASWGLAAQAEQTGIKYFLSGPNASDRIGRLAQWQDKPFYWLSPSGKQKMLFWQCPPYSIGYGLKGDKIPNFFNVEDPKPFYTGKPSENFLNPYLFDHLQQLESKNFPYDLSILTWAMSDNAPIDPELPDAVQLWNQHYVSPKLVITSVKQFFNDFEKKYAKEIPTYSGDYTEYWTDGVSSGASETAKNRHASEVLKQADAIWAIRNVPNYSRIDFSETWKNMLLFNEHTWGAYNSTDDPDDAKVKSQWSYKQAFALRAEKKSDSLLASSLSPLRPREGYIDVYNTNMWKRTDIVVVPASLSKSGDIVKDLSGRKIPSQRLSSGELVFIATDVPPFGKSTFIINKGRNPQIKNSPTFKNTITNGIYTIVLDNKTGDIKKLIRNNKNYANDSVSLNQYLYMPGDLLKNMESSGTATITYKENGPLVQSLMVRSDAPGTKGLEREIKLISNVDRIEIINTIDKTAVRSKESVHFAFPFSIPGGQVRYNIPWAAVTAESDQLPNSNRNWYTMQRWVDISNANYGLTWSSPDAPLFEIGKIKTANLLGGLQHSPYWVDFTSQSSIIYSWVMNNLWHTNFRADQQGKTTFHYFIQAHDGGYDSFKASQAGIYNHQPLLVTSASTDELSGIVVKGKNIYTEVLKPADDQQGYIAIIVNTSEEPNHASVISDKGKSFQLFESNLMEDKLKRIDQNFTIPGKGVMTIRIENL
ncbi:glycoside hydrolase [Mucilaginibacter terrenus]|uniref:Glycoside hydrolase n=1 Tax=Mucilaginibacter terrenus TaxID=2482727 RepID=A0A3E2NW31_9SPHI|nr:glycoside hydrolase family 38 C-terminal domain-containing protein [Mucilaginibacter terrenus]RFZ85226.1 glycoside hydrolase [Mucilaginibacter terrenus]